MSQSNVPTRRLRLVEEPKRSVRYTFGFGIPDGPEVAGRMLSPKGSNPHLDALSRSPAVVRIGIDYLARVEAAVAGDPRHAELLLDTKHLVDAARRNAESL